MTIPRPQVQQPIRGGRPPGISRFPLCCILFPSYTSTPHPPPHLAYKLLYQVRKASNGIQNAVQILFTVVRSGKENLGTQAFWIPFAGTPGNAAVEPDSHICMRGEGGPPPRARTRARGYGGRAPELYYRRKHGAAAVFAAVSGTPPLPPQKYPQSPPAASSARGGREPELLPKTIHVRKMTGYEWEAAGGGAPAVRYSAYRRKRSSVAKRQRFLHAA